MLVDSNIIIYAVRPENTFLRSFFENHLPAVSAISRVEVLGYHNLTREVQQRLEGLFNVLRILPVSESVIDRAIDLRQQRKMSLGDALIAGTALENRMTLVTRNKDDFKWIDGLALLNPFQDPIPQQDS